MEMLGIAAMMFVVALLVVSLFYIHRTTKHKELMRMVEKGIDPNETIANSYRKETYRAGILMCTAGLGFFTGILLEQSAIFPSSIELPLYFGPILIYSGIGLLISLRFSNKKS